VAIGAVAALWSVTVLAALAGSRLARVLPATVVNRASACLFAAIGVVIVVTSFSR
jgi:putative Ca2+/H+ antiporter (TMEM165/GDT1 family)